MPRRPAVGTAVIAVAAIVVILLGVLGVVSLTSRSNTPTQLGASSSISSSSPGLVLTTNSTPSSSNGSEATSTQSTATNTTVVASTTSTLPCNAPGVTCGSFTIVSAKLVAGSQTNNGTMLSVIITNTSTGDGNITGLVYFINGQQVGQSQGVLLGGTLTYTIPIPSTVSIAAGQTYYVNIEAFFAGANLYREVSVVAT
jgi:hypothetical protein